MTQSSLLSVFSPRNYSLAHYFIYRSSPCLSLSSVDPSLCFALIPFFFLFLSLSLSRTHTHTLFLTNCLSPSSSLSQVISRLLLRLSAVSGLTSFLIYVGDANTYTSSSSLGLGSAPSDSRRNSSLSHGSVSGFGNGLFLRILNREYGFQLPNRSRCTVQDDVRSTEDGIKVSYYYRSNDVYNNDGTSNNSTNNYDSNNDKNDTYDKKNDKKVNKNETLENNSNSKTKLKAKSYAKIPLQFHEFENVRKNLTKNYFAS